MLSNMKAVTQVWKVAWVGLLITDGWTPTRVDRLAYNVTSLQHTDRKDRYWACCCTFCTQLSCPLSLTVMASACTSMPMTRRLTSAHWLVTLRLPSDVSHHVFSTSRHGWRLADFEWTSPRSRWCGWVLHNSWRRSTFRRFPWRRHVSSRRRHVGHGVIVDSQLTMSGQVAAVCRSGYYQIRQLRPLGRSMSSNAFKTLVQAFISCRLGYCNSIFTASRTIWWTGCSLYRMQLRGWFLTLDAVTI